VDVASTLENIQSSANKVGDAPSILFQYSLSINGAAIQGLSKSAVDMLLKNEDISQIIEVSNK